MKQQQPAALIPTRAARTDSAYLTYTRRRLAEVAAHPVKAAPPAEPNINLSHPTGDARR